MTFTQGIKHALSGEHKDIEYVKAHPKMFGKKFFKDHIATNRYALMFWNNVFEYMPLYFIDEEMVACAMFESVRNPDENGWFYSVHKRKPEVLTQDLYTLGARCFGQDNLGLTGHDILSITPEEYRTQEFYFALCLGSHTPVMQRIPKSILKTNFLVKLVNDSPKNIRCFSEKALEREVYMKGRGIVKFWQVAVINDGYQMGHIPLNDERIKFFFSIYDKDSPQYEYGYDFQYNLRMYFREKNSTHKPAAMTHSEDREYHLPIHYVGKVPPEYSKKYTREEYLLEIYKKIGIQILGDSDYYDHYFAILPENISIEEDHGYSIKDSDGNTLIHYLDQGPFYDKTIEVDQIYITL